MSMLRFVTVTKRKGAKRFKAAATSEEEGGPSELFGDQSSKSSAENRDTKTQNKMNTSQEAKEVTGGECSGVASEGGKGFSSGDGQRAQSSQASAKGMVFKEIKGDLFGSPDTTCLVHCISADCRMGKGIAKIFKEKFGGVRELLAQGVRPGGVAVLQRDKRFIYYLVTKEKYSNQPTYQDLQSSLDALRSHCTKHDVSAIAMPRIGCGLDGLQWKKVSLMVTIHNIWISRNNYLHKPPVSLKTVMQERFVKMYDESST